MKKKILFITRGKDDASTRYRVAPLIPLLAESGWNIRQLSRHSKFLRSRMLLASLSGQTIFIQRKLFGLAFLNLLGLTKPRIIFDFDDAVFVKRSGKSDARTLKRFKCTIQKASLILAGNQYLENKANQFVQKGAVLLAPTSIDCKKYTQVHDTEATPRQLVWVGSQSTRKYLESAAEALSEIAGRVPGITLKIIADFAWKHPDMPVECIPWTQATEAQELSGCLAGIAPMTDTPWARGKCGLKVLQYMAAGVPVIASDVGVHREIIDQKKTGLLVSTPAEWADAVESLVADSTLQSKLREAGQESVKKFYNTSTQAERLSRAFNELVEKGASSISATSQSINQAF